MEVVFAHSHISERDLAKLAAFLDLQETTTLNFPALTGKIITHISNSTNSVSSCAFYNTH
jgi:hypothetical protein